MKSLLTSCPTAQQCWSLTILRTMLTAETILNIILASPAPMCQPAILIFPLSESKLFLSLIWLYDSCSPVPSKLLFSRIEIFTFQSLFNDFFLIICSAEDPISTLGLQGDIQRYRLHGVSGRLFTQKGSSCPQKTPDRRVAEGNEQCQHKALGYGGCQFLHQIIPRRALMHLIFECLKALWSMMCCQCWDAVVEGT